MIRFTVAACVALVLLSGCVASSEGGQRVATPASRPTRAASGAEMNSSERVTQREQYGSARLDPPGASATPTVTRDAAIQIFEREGLFPETGKDTPHSVRLAAYSDDVYGAQIGKDGQPNAVYRDRLVWAFVYNDVPPRVHSLPAGIKAEEAVPPGTRCAFVVLIDAQSGAFIVGSQECSPPGQLPAGTGSS